MGRIPWQDDPDQQAMIDDVLCVRETEKALLCLRVDEPDEEVWIPKSQIHDDSEVYKFGTQGVLICSKWIATEKGWM